MDKQLGKQLSVHPSSMMSLASLSGYSSSKVCATMRGAEKREGRSRKRRRGEEEDTTISFEPRGCCSCKRGCQKLSESSRTPQFYSPPSHLQRWQRKGGAMLCALRHFRFKHDEASSTLHIFIYLCTNLKFTIALTRSHALDTG